jgi:hypothetical protein
MVLPVTWGSSSSGIINPGPRPAIERRAGKRRAATPCSHPFFLKNCSGETGMNYNGSYPNHKNAIDIMSMPHPLLGSLGRSVDPGFCLKFWFDHFHGKSWGMT